MIKIATQLPHRLAWLTIGAGAATAWLLIGQLSEDPGGYYLIRLPQLDRWIELSAGTLSLAVALGALGILIRRCLSWLRKGWLGVYSQVFVAALFAAVSGRIVTAGSNGANIGGGLLLFAGPLLLVWLVAGAYFDAKQIWKNGACDQPGVFPWLLLVSVLVAVGATATD